ncbi:MAG TPA: imidazole glycerol phosphate synthase subunit HisH [Oleiagrimonas sp.]|nr:imidazole glycerol phosphate synthase subunit HisH [Oleiagrimonas sp.]
MDVVLVEAGGTNIGSVRYALERLGVVAELTGDPARIRAASHVILPGVGAAAEGMRRLREQHLDVLLRELTQPVLGVCLGMQLLFVHSEEGDTETLGLLEGNVRKLSGGSSLRIPHMGWNRLDIERDDPLLDGIAKGAHAYFVHGYAAPVTSDTLASCEHGERFAAVVRKNNFCGMQCHPERSGALGSRLLKNFLNL